MKTRYLIPFALAALMALGLCACGSPSNPVNTGNEPTPSDVTNATNHEGAAIQESDTAEGDAQDGESSQEEATPTGDAGYSKMSEVFSANGEDSSWSYDKETFTYSFKKDGEYIIVAAKLSDGMYDKLEAAGYDSDKVEKLLADTEVASIERNPLPTQEQVDSQFVGKTGAEISAAGYAFQNFTVNDDETDCNITDGTFSYLVGFAGTIDENTDAAALADAVKDLKAVNASVQALAF